MGEQNETRESTYFPTNEENLALIKKIRKGKRAERKFLKSIDLKEEEKNRLLKSIREGNEAQNKILDINRSFVWTVVKRYESYCKNLDDKEDLFQEGWRGILRALEDYDEKRAQFTTYAEHWVKHNIQRYVANNFDQVRLPVHAFEAVQKKARIERTREQNGERNLTDSEMKKELNIGADVYEAIRLYKPTTSLNQRVRSNGYEDDTELGDVMKLESPLANPEEELLMEEMVMILAGAMKATLTNREIGIIIKHWGFFDGKQHTLDQIGNFYGITGERARQIEVKAFQKMKDWIENAVRYNVNTA